MLSPTQVAAIRYLYVLAFALFTTAVTILVAENAPSVRAGEALGVFGTSNNAAAVFDPAVGYCLTRLSKPINLYCSQNRKASARLPVPLLHKPLIKHGEAVARRRYCLCPTHF